MYESSSDDFHEMPSNQKEFIYFKKIVDSQNLAHAQFIVPTCFEDGKYVSSSFKKAFYYYKLVGDQEDSTALACLGHLYAEGKGVEQSFEQAFKYCQQAANDDCPMD